MSRALSSAWKRSTVRSTSLGGDPLSLGGVGDRLAVLVGAGEKEHVSPALAHVARDHVGGDLLVGVP
jgi:hypothetical protein